MSSLDDRGFNICEDCREGFHHTQALATSRDLDVLEKLERAHGPCDCGGCNHRIKLQIDHLKAVKRNA